MFFVGVLGRRQVVCKFEGLLKLFHEQHFCFSKTRANGLRLKAWQKPMPRDAERPFVSCKHGKAKRAKTRKKQANSADMGAVCGPARGHLRTADDARW